MGLVFQVPKVTPRRYVDRFTRSCPHQLGGPQVASSSSQNCATKPERPSAPAQRTLPPAPLPLPGAHAHSKALKPGRAYPGARPPGSPGHARARALAARSRGRVPPRRPGRAARHRPDSPPPPPPAGPGCWSWRGGDTRWKSGGAGAAAVAGSRLEAAAPLGRRPPSGPPAIPAAAAARAPAGPARSRLRAQGAGGGPAGPAYPAAWRSLRSPWRPRGPAPAVPRPRRRLLLREPSGGEGTRRRCRGARGASPLTRRAAAAPDAQRGRREDAAGAGWGRRDRGRDWAGPR